MAMAAGNPSSGAGQRIVAHAPLARPTGAIGSLFSPSAGNSLLGSQRVVRPWLHLVLLVAALLAARAAGAPVGPRAGFLAWILVPLVIGLLAARGSYRRCIQLDPAGDLLQIVLATSLATIAVLALEDLMTPTGHSGALVIRAWILSTVLLWASALLLTLTERHLRRAGAASVPTLLVGAGQVGSMIERRLREEPELGLDVVGYLDPDPNGALDPAELGAPILGRPGDLAAVLEATGARHVIFSFTSSPDGTLIPLIRTCEDRGVQVSLVPRMFERVNRRASLESIGALPLFSLGHVDPKGWQFAVKHGFDRVSSALLLALISPLLVGIAVAVKLSSPGPVLYRQRRVGRDGRHFEMLKFRSMRPAAAASGASWLADGIAPGGVEGEDRRTAIGCFIRRYSLDELPQLLNVLRGEMSMIGPRPERPEFVALFDQRVRGYSDRHRVKSGITGLAQTKGLRGQTSLTDRIELDNYYIQHWSMTLDLRILLATFGAVLRSAE